MAEMTMPCLYGRVTKSNALNTLLAYITRQSTLNKLMESGINVFADAAGTTLRPALDILSDVVERWQDNAEAMPMTLVEIADEMGVMSEEMSEIIGLTDEWTQMQKLELEQSIAGVRRRNYLIALMRNFAMAQEVVVNMQDSENYSMEQNAKTMETLEKRYNQLKMAATELAVAIGEAGLMDQIKGVVDGTRDTIEWFNGLSDTTRGLIIVFAEFAIGLKLIRTLLAMGGITAAGGLVGVLTALKGVPMALVGALGGPWGLALTAAGVGIVTLTTQLRRYNKETEEAIKNANNLANDIKNLRDRYVELANKTEKTNAEKEEFKRVTYEITQLLPQTVTGFDSVGEAITNVATVTEVATNRIKELKNEYAAFIRAQAAVAETRLPELEKELGAQKRKYYEFAEAMREGPKATREALYHSGGGVIEGYLDNTLATWDRIASLFGSDALSGRIMKRAEDVLQRTLTEMEETQKRINEYEAARKALEALEKGVVEAEYDYTGHPARGQVPPREKTSPPGFPDPTTPGFPDPTTTAESTAAVKKLSDIINKFIETALRAAEVQGMLNDEIQREMDGLQARISFYDKETATAWERNQVLQDEIRLRELALEKQEGIHQEANFLREALTKLEQRQQSLNIQTDEGWQAYKQLESQIESIKDTIGRLGIEWFKLEGIINDNTRAIKEAEQAYKDAISTLDYFNRFGIYTAEQYLSEVNRIYNQQGALTLEQERDLYSRRYDAYKQMLNDMKREADEAYKERIKLLEKETEAQIDNYKKRIELLEKETQATIDAIQRQIDALDEEAERENREEERRKHEEKLQELYDERRYHELRTGREHSQAILDIDKRIMEEERLWELRQAEWTRQDKKAKLQKEIEDVREAAQQQREILERKIEDVRDAAEKQREVWEETYQRMQEDFSDHNINLLATAAAYDSDFWEDAKNKGELWVEGFKNGTSGFFSYLDSLVRQAKKILGGIGGGSGGYYGGSDYGDHYWDSEGGYAGGGGTGTGQYVGGEKGAGGWEVVDEGDSYYVPGIGHVPKGAEGGLLDRPRFVYAGEAGAEALLPIEKLQPMMANALSDSIQSLNTTIISPNLSAQLERLIRLLTTRLLPSNSQAQQQWRDGGVEIRGNLLNIENANFEDETDMEILARELNRQLTSLRN